MQIHYDPEVTQSMWRLEASLSLLERLTASTEGEQKRFVGYDCLIGILADEAGRIAALCTPQ